MTSEMVSTKVHALIDYLIVSYKDFVLFDVSDNSRSIYVANNLSVEEATQLRDALSKAIEAIEGNG